MEHLDTWRANLRWQIKIDFNQMEDEDDFVHRNVVNNPLSLHGIGREWRKEAGGSTARKRPNKDRKKERGHA